MKNLLLPIVCAAVAVALPAQAQIASDNASNYGGTWGNGSNGGTGFLAWSIVNNDGDGNFAGTFIGDSTAGAGDINTSGDSFGLYANPTGPAFVNADRAFATALAVGNVFTFQIALNNDNGNKGFNLFAGTQGEVFNFNVGGGGSVSSAGATLNPGTGAGYNYGGNDAVLDVEIVMSTTTTFAYEIARTSSLGNQGVLFSGTVSGLIDNVTGFRFYNSGTDAGIDQNNLYVNSLEVIPEPTTFALLGAGLGAWILRRKTKRLS